MKKIGIFALILLGLSAIFFTGCGKKTIDENPEVYAKTLQISQNYVALRHRSEQLLVNAREYDYLSWNAEMDQLLAHWITLEQDAQTLEQLSNTTILASNSSFSLENFGFGFGKVYAYDSYEVSDIFDKAPAGKKIATLAQHLGVDAKRAFQILQQAQAGITADAWNEAGDTFQKLETSATLIKDGCKVAGFVGGIAVGGGVASLAGKSLLSQATVVVGGADLILEVTDDAAKIALGNHNQVSSFVGNVRTVTEPLANILTITDIPNNLDSGFDKFSAVMVALDSFRGAAQEGSILGISLPAYETDSSKEEKSQNPIVVSVLSADEVDTWLQASQKTTIELVEKSDLDTLQELLDIVKTAESDPLINTSQTINSAENQEDLVEFSDKIQGYWEGDIFRTSSESSDPESIKWSMEFGNDGSLKRFDFGNGKSEDSTRRTQEDNHIKIYLLDEEGRESYFEFMLDGDSLIFLKLVGSDLEGYRDERLAGSEFFGGTFFAGTLKQKK